MHAMPGEYSPSVVRLGAVPSCEKLVPGRLFMEHQIIAPVIFLASRG